jgi:hypothetical protein
MGAWKLVLACLLLTASSVVAAEAEISGYADGSLEFTVKGSGTAAITAQADFKYISSKTVADALARATSDPLKIKLTETPVPIKIAFNPPEGSVTEVEVIVFINGEEKARRTFGF